MAVGFIIRDAVSKEDQKVLDAVKRESGRGTMSGAVWWAVERFQRQSKELADVTAERDRYRDMVDRFREASQAEVGATDAASDALKVLIDYKPAGYRRPVR